MDADFKVIAEKLAAVAVLGEKRAGVPAAPGAARAAQAAAAAPAPAPAPAAGAAQGLALPGNISELFSTAMANPYIRNSLLGAGAGGLLGLATGGRRKWRDALHYGLLGGLGGAGLTAGYDMMSNKTPPPAAPTANPAGAAMKKTYQFGATAAAPVATLAAMGAADKALPAAGKALSKALPRTSAAASSIGKSIAAGAAKLPGAARVGRFSRWGLPLAAAYNAAQATGLTDGIPFVGRTSK